MNTSNCIAALLMICGTLFFVAGIVGLIRFPDIYTRLHALTKSDNIGLGLVAAGLAVQSESWLIAGKLLLIWMLVLLAAASVANLIASGALQRGIRMWRR